MILYYAISTVVFVVYLRSRHSPLQLRPAPFEWRFVTAITRVGGLSAIGTVVSNLTVVLVTGAVGLYGTKALAGYGIASRLDYLLIPLLFGLGSAAVHNHRRQCGRRAGGPRKTCCGGDGADRCRNHRHDRRSRCAVSNAWSGLFTSDPEVLAISAQFCASSAHPTCSLAQR